MQRMFMFYIMLVPVLSNCQIKSKINTEDIVITKRLYSPDSVYIALTFLKDKGAMGESQPVTSILKTIDTTDDITTHTLPCLVPLPYSCYYPDRWLDNKTLQVFLNERAFVQNGIHLDTSSFTFGDVQIKVAPYDYSYESTPLIEHFSFSPNKKKLLVAYRYRGTSELNVSVINYGDKLPRIGNIFTNFEVSYNPILFGRWNGEEIDLILASTDEFKKNDFLNKELPVEVNFVNKEKYPKQKMGYNHWVNSKLYEESFVDSILKSKGRKVEASIIKTKWQMENGISTFYYEYEYNVKGQAFRSYFRLFKPFSEGYDFKMGDNIFIIYDDSEPFIHKTIQNFGR